MKTRMPTKLVTIALSSLGLLAIVIPFSAALEGDPQSEAANNIGKRGVIDYASSWKLRKESGWTTANLTKDESVVLMSLCRLAIGANGGPWQSVRINAAISVLAFGDDPPDNLQASVYKTCMMAGGMERRSR